MIVVKLNGGIGNQMFQYAAGRRLAAVRNTELQLDTSEFQHYKLRVYELHAFNIRAKIAKQIELGAPRGFLTRFFPFKPRLKYVKEKHFHFDRSILDLPDNVCLEGFWQSPKYFQDVASVIKKELSVKFEPGGLNRKLLKEIDRKNSVGIHIRRGDYVANSTTYKFHGLPTPDYYKKSVALIAGKVKKPSFYIFSDDPKWCRKNFKLDFPTIYISHNGPSRAYEDMRLMSHCQHFIIANSTFGWWGAWLCDNKNKLVIAPKRWFAQPDIDTKDLIPKLWISI